jgi:DNA-directed RNA polymerase beta' subunit
VDNQEKFEGRDLYKEIRRDKKEFHISWAIDKKSSNQVVSAEDALGYLKKIKRKDCLGFMDDLSSPSDLIIQHLLIPPPHVRPSVDFGQG